MSGLIHSLQDYNSVKGRGEREERKGKGGFAAL